MQKSSRNPSNRRGRDKALTTTKAARTAPGLPLVAPPCFDDDLCLGEAVEDLAVEQFIAKLRDEALAVAVLPRAARLDERGLGADSCNPLSHCLGDELRPVIRTNVAGHAA